MAVLRPSQLTVLLERVSAGRSVRLLTGPVPPRQPPNASAGSQCAVGFTVVIYKMIYQKQCALKSVTKSRRQPRPAGKGDKSDLAARPRAGAKN